MFLVTLMDKPFLIPQQPRVPRCFPEGLGDLRHSVQSPDRCGLGSLFPRDQVRLGLWGTQATCEGLAHSRGTTSLHRPESEAVTKPLYLSGPHRDITAKQKTTYS